MEKQQPNSYSTRTKWKATVTAKLPNASPDQIWPFLKDFFGIHKYFPSLSASHGVHGTNGEVGSVRHCEGSRIPALLGRKKDEPLPVSWSDEKLIAMDSDQMSLSYEMVDSNIGFSSYVSTIGVSMDPEDGCVLRWSFSVNPIEGLDFEDLVKKYEVGLQKMARKMMDALWEN